MNKNQPFWSQKKHSRIAQRMQNLQNETCPNTIEFY